jgi:hypothetical protein
MHEESSMTIPSVTLETKCWENDWEFLLRTDRLKRTIELSGFNFAKRTLCINNVEDVAKVSRYAERLVHEGVLNNVVIVREHEKAALDFFELSREDFTSGFVYSIAELVGLYVCDTDYLLHYSGDSRPVGRTDWLSAALTRFESDPRAKVANLTWNGNYAEAASEAFAEDEKFYIGYGFSDQMYFVRTADFRSPEVYHESNPVSARYPRYGGELFEKRVDSWMRNHEYYRLTYRFGAYEHRNFPSSGMRRKAALWRARLFGQADGGIRRT